MELAQLLSTVFPTGEPVLQGDRFEVIGLQNGSQPQNCEVLMRGAERTLAGYRREHFLVQTGAGLLFFRICTSRPGLGYEEVAIGQGFAVGKRDEKRLMKVALATIRALCADGRPV